MEKIVLRMDDVGASTKHFEVYSKKIFGNFLFLKYLPYFRANSVDFLGVAMFPMFFLCFVVVSLFSFVKGFLPILFFLLLIENIIENSGIGFLGKPTLNILKDLKKYFENGWVFSHKALFLLEMFIQKIL